MALAEGYTPVFIPESKEQLVEVFVAGAKPIHPLTWQQAADQLAKLQPDQSCTSRKVEHRGGRLTSQGSRDEVGEPVGNSLNDTLLKELVRSASLVLPDLRLLTEAG